MGERREQGEQREQRRRHATVLFADVAGFTALSETMDPELVADLMDELWRTLDDVIEALGGEVDKHIGDSVMGVWGARSSAEDDPERAVRAGLDLLDGFERFRAGRGLELDIRAGVNTGPVLWGDIGTRGEQSVTGDAVNVAKRVEGAAPANRLLITHDTYRHVQGVFEVTPLDPVELKGKAAPVRVHLVERAKPRAFRLPAPGVEGVMTAMVGRDAELAALQAAFEQASHSGHPVVVTVVGEPGTGKSRLLLELSTWLELRPEGITYLKGRSTPHLTSEPRGLLRQLFAARFDVFEDDGREVVAAKVRAGFDALDRSDADVLAHWLGFDLGPSDDVDALAGSSDLAAIARSHLVRATNALVGDDPAVLLLEDVHWADDDSLRAVTDLVERLADSRLLVVALARPTVDEVHAWWGAGPGDSSRIVLEPLDDADANRLVRDILCLVEGLPDQLVELVAGQADGNPFYVEELVKTLIDDGAIVPAEPGAGPWLVERRRLDSISLPGTLAGVLQARLDSLDPADRRSLQHAAVVGRTFWDDAVASLLGEPTPAVVDSLDRARARELVHRTDRSAFADCAELRFKHALLRDAAYESVLLKERPRLHAAAAAWIERRAGDRIDEHLGALAEHFERAGDDVRAAELLARAGLRATATGALVAGARLLVRALDCRARLGLDHDLEATELRVELGDLLDRQGDPAAARQQLALAAADATEHGDDRLRGLALGNLARVVCRSSEFDEAHRLLDDALPSARAAGGVVLCEVLLGQSWLLEMTGKPGVGMEPARQALATARECGSIDRELRALNQLAIASTRLGDMDGALALLDEALALAGRIGNAAREAMLLSTRGSMAHLRAATDGPEALREAIGFYRRSVELGAGLFDVMSATAAVINLAQAEVEVGEVDIGEARAHEVLRYKWARGIVSDAGFAALVLAQARLARGDRVRALAIMGTVARDGRVEAMDEEVSRILAAHDIDPDEGRRLMAGDDDGLPALLDILIAEPLAREHP